MCLLYLPVVTIKYRNSHKGLGELKRVKGTLNRMQLLITLHFLFLLIFPELSKNWNKVFYFLYNTMHVLRMKQCRMLLDT